MVGVTGVIDGLIGADVGGLNRDMVDESMGANMVSLTGSGV